MGLMKNFTWKWLNTALKLVASFSFNLSIDQGACKRLQSKVFIRIPLHFGGICGQMSISGDCPSVLFSLLVGFCRDLF